MMLFRCLFLLFSLSLLALPTWAQEAATPEALAQPADPFTVTGIAIDMPVSSPQAARDQALAAAQHAGYQKLKEQIAAANPGTTLPDASDAQLNHMMQTFEVAGERISARRYIGTYTIHFRPSVVQGSASGAIAGAAASSQPVAAATSSVSATYRFPTLPDWVEAEQRLHQIPGMKDVDVVAIGKSYVRVDLQYVGTREALITTLSNAAFDLMETSPDSWELRRKASQS